MRYYNFVIFKYFAYNVDKMLNATFYVIFKHHAMQCCGVDLLGNGLQWHRLSNHCCMRYTSQDISMRADEIVSTDKIARLTLTSIFPDLPAYGRFL